MYRRPCANKGNVKNEGFTVSVETVSRPTFRFEISKTFAAFGYRRVFFFGSTERCDIGKAAFGVGY